MFCALAFSAASAADAIQVKVGSKTHQSHRRGHKNTLTNDERSSLLIVARNARKLHYSGHDCSHMVHAIYEKAGFPYRYADSEDLYDGVDSFERVSEPKPGDLIVWHGHVGMVIRPSEHEFFSFLSRGPGVDDYRSHYWRGRGPARFYRYVKAASCSECTVARSGAE